MNRTVTKMCVSKKFYCDNFTFLSFGKTRLPLFQCTVSVYLSLITPLCTGQGKIKLYTYPFTTRHLASDPIRTTLQYKILLLCIKQDAILPEQTSRYARLHTPSRNVFLNCFPTNYIKVEWKISEFRNYGYLNLRSFGGKLRHTFEDDIAHHFLHITHSYVRSSRNDTQARARAGTPRHTHKLSHTNSTAAVSNTKASLYK